MYKLEESGMTSDKNTLLVQMDSPLFWQQSNARQGYWKWRDTKR